MTDTNAMRAKLISTLKAAGGIHNPDANAPHIADAILALLATDRAAGVGEAKSLRDNARWLVDRASHHGNYAAVDQDHIDGLRDAVNAFDAASPPAPADASGEVREVLSAIVAQNYVGKPGSAATRSKWAHYPSGLFHRAVAALAQEPRS